MRAKLTKSYGRLPSGSVVSGTLAQTLIAQQIAVEVKSASATQQHSKKDK